MTLKGKVECSSGIGDEWKQNQHLDEYGSADGTLQTSPVSSWLVADEAQDHLLGANTHSLHCAVESHPFISPTRETGQMPPSGVAAPGGCWWDTQGKLILFQPRTAAI